MCVSAYLNIIFDIVLEPVLWVFRKATFLALEPGAHCGQLLGSGPNESEGGGQPSQVVVELVVVVVVVVVVEDFVVGAVEEDPVVVLNELLTFKSPGNETIVVKMCNWLFQTPKK